MNADAAQVARTTSRAAGALEAALWDIEAALLLEREATSAEVAWRAALARVAAPERAVATARRSRFEHARVHGGVELRAYAADHGVGGARMTTSSGGARIFRVVSEAFPQHINYVYFLDLGDVLVQWDCGSGLGRSRAMILDGLTLCSRVYAAKLSVEEIDVVIVSHGHYDHFGDAGWWKDAARAPLWIHDLDARVVERFDERTALTGRDMRIWLRGAGCDETQVGELVGLYMASKDIFSSVPVDRRLRHGQRLFPAPQRSDEHAGRARLVHTPGHCPGHVCMRIDDVLLTADQVLAPVTPHLSPQALHPGNGVERYISGLGRLAREEGVRHVLPAHFDAIPDLGARIKEIAEGHVDKLQRVLDACSRGAAVVDVAALLYGPQQGYHSLLAVLEAGAHVEFLHQHGAISVANLDEVAADPLQAARYLTSSSADVASLPLDPR